MFGSFGSEVCPPYAKTLLDDQRFIAFMISSELIFSGGFEISKTLRQAGLRKKKCNVFIDSSKIFRVFFMVFSLWDILNHETSYRALFHIRSQLAKMWNAGSYELAVYSPEALHLNINGFHRGQPEGFQPLGSWLRLTADFSRADFSTAWFGCQGKLRFCQPHQYWDAHHLPDVPWSWYSSQVLGIGSLKMPVLICLFLVKALCQWHFLGDYSLHLDTFLCRRLSELHSDMSKWYLWLRCFCTTFVEHTPKPLSTGYQGIPLRKGLRGIDCQGLWHYVDPIVVSCSMDVVWMFLGYSGLEKSHWYVDRLCVDDACGFLKGCNRCGERRRWWRRWGDHCPNHSSKSFRFLTKIKAMRRHTKFWIHKDFFCWKKPKVGIPVSMRIFLMLTIFLPRFLIQKSVVVGCLRVTSLNPGGFCLPRNALEFCWVYWCPLMPVLLLFLQSCISIGSIGI